ncbi:hypothetical protein B6N60_03317 [Richelia sinica FACHB-800]|uniref:Microcin J25-processing protein McjB C-terminal domain-containing protein n=1 Tax=Richelia sinica FACHB-800 TaxID=1357546 RepID=A0A975TAY9_9NOST|nr:lasso peptide biosynthesis B2 protein [Richelia sinica]MBD2663431.1 lasso peptide biosynthesis B2 protein [Richelia sinica FACHB-800]QXE24611.1 hypothetical protein B6N60_03317 [Richelia sinica FACHB-800]
MKHLHKWLRLRNSDRQLLLTTAITLTMIRLGLWLLPWKILYKLVNRIVQLPLDHPEADEAIWCAVVWAVETVSRYLFPPPKCLARALVTQILLAWQGYRTKLCIGVAKNPQGNLEAHAWVESQGKIIIGKLTNQAKFIPLSSLHQSFT